MRAAPLAILAVTSCGDGLAGSDAAVSDVASAGLVSLRYVTGGSGTAAGHLVFFQNANGSVVAITQTRPDGIANAFMADGGYVTVVVSVEGSTQLWTYMGVRGGDELVVDRTQTLFPEKRSFRVRVPPDPGASSYELQSRCGTAAIDGAESAPLEVTFLCEPGPLDLLVLTRVGGTIFHSLLREGVQVTPQTLVVFDPPYDAPRTTTVTTIGLPAEVAGLFVTAGSVGARDLFYSQSLFAEPSAGTASVTFALPATTKIGTTIDLHEPFDSLMSRHLVDWSSTGEHHVIDYPTMSLPAYTAWPTFDSATRTLTWSELGGVMPDAAIAAISYGGVAEQPRQWMIIAPRTAEPVLAFPVLPVGELMPRPEDSVFPYALTTMSAAGGYDRIRPNVLGRIPNGSWPMTGAAGRAVYQDLTQRFDSSK